MRFGFPRLSIAHGRFRLRYQQLYRYRSSVRHAGSIGHAGGRAAPAQHELLLDYVPNHTSDRHPWFIEARASRFSAKRDWYIWRDPAPGGGAPNNWRSQFRRLRLGMGRASGQYYYHAFLKQQPDLNWRNPHVRAAMFDVLRFWLDRGVDGFRVDVMHRIVKDDEFRDNPFNPRCRPGMSPYRELLPTYSSDVPRCMKPSNRCAPVVEEYDDRMLVGEIYLPVNDWWPTMAQAAAARICRLISS